MSGRRICHGPVVQTGQNLVPQKIMKNRRAAGASIGLTADKPKGRLVGADQANQPPLNLDLIAAEYARFIGWVRRL